MSASSPSAMHRPTRAVIDPAAFASNLDFVRRKVGEGVAIMAVIKSNGYGHGVETMGREALRWGVQAIGVATVDEALHLRETEGFGDVPLLVLGPSFENDAEALQRAHVSATVGSNELLDAHLRTARSLGAPARIHVKLDTGMGRYGYAAEDTTPLDKLASVPECLEGIMTHLSVSDEEGPEEREYTRWQLERFERAWTRAAEAGMRFIRHASNSGGVLHHPDAHLDMVRPGMMLYGANPEPRGGALPELEQVMTLVTRIVSIHDRMEGESISYGRTHRMAREGRVAILPIGYGDGFPRALGNKAHALVHGRRFPIIGRVCMDQTMVDVTDLPQAAVGDPVVLYGKQGMECIPLEEVALNAGTIPYEITCQLGKRVPRVVHDRRVPDG